MLIDGNTVKNWFSALFNLLDESLLGALGLMALIAWTSPYLLVSTLMINVLSITLTASFLYVLISRRRREEPTSKRK